MDDTLSIRDTIDASLWALRADQVPHIQGPPGIGKSTIARAIARTLGLPLVTAITSQWDQVDSGGFPIVNGGSLTRIPLGAIKAVADAPGLLFLDEITQTIPSVQATLMRGILDRVFGDTPIHPDTRIMLASNSSAQAAGGNDLALPLMSRIQTTTMRPTLQEVQGYFDALGAPGSTLATLGVDFSATLDVQPDLLQIDPPAGALERQVQWGNPRNWERALRVLASAIDAGAPDTHPAINATINGNAGQVGISFLALRRVRKDLPSVQEITRDPAGARLPSSTEIAFASIGLIAHVCTIDPCAGWVYAERLAPEVRSGAYRTLLRKGGIDTPAARKSPHATLAQRARVRLQAQCAADQNI